MSAAKNLTNYESDSSSFLLRMTLMGLSFYALRNTYMPPCHSERSEESNKL